ncbi:uncharacterized protein L201_002922 [Kwoniella dendrophila CBS 6074]|uniref:Splicing factor YJU2 n=1 Tax=Kwoniella dendrophila CBS 6074 TaxID=1295534 RepID=A0AAX4JRY2_9TREE
MPKDPQQVIRLMAPFSMRCNRCGEYVYKGKKFNARKETAQGEEYYGIKIFRFYIKCPMCSSEITFKTDPKNADYICEQGATRNFENWSETDKKATHLPGAEEDDEYDSDGNPLESKIEKDAMADLEKSQEQSKREMELMDELADLRQRNARLELSNVSSDPNAVLAALHAEKVSIEEEAKRKAEEDEDDALVKQYFSKISAPSPSAASSSKPQAKIPNGEKDGDDDNSQNSDSEEDTALPAALTIKRRPVPGSSTTSTAEPSVASILALKGKTLDGQANGSNTSSAAPAQAKRKREGMQKLLGIKKKTKA